MHQGWDAPGVHHWEHLGSFLHRSSDHQPADSSTLRALEDASALQVDMQDGAKLASVTSARKHWGRQNSWTAGSTSLTPDAPMWAERRASS